MITSHYFPFAHALLVDKQTLADSCAYKLSPQRADVTLPRLRSAVTLPI